MEPLQFFCLRCAAPVEILPEFSKLTQDRGVLCLICIAADERKEMLEGAKDLLAAKWERLCPALFQDTDESKLPCVAASAKALEWNYGPKGLNLWGVPNTGKSRTAYLVLRREHSKGRTILALGPGEFASQLESVAWKRGPWIARLSRVDILFLDDLDKTRFSKDYENVFFGIVDKRMTSKRPIIITHNSTAAKLEYNFRHGEALVRRIRDFCVSIHFGKP